MLSVDVRACVVEPKHHSSFSSERGARTTQRGVKTSTRVLCVDGSDSRDKPKLYRLQHSITEVGSDCTEDGAIQVPAPQLLDLSSTPLDIFSISS